ncbi:MAG TPA: type III-B CRISPR-associated protein Cas10/Cmr2 [Spirochaetota bacterium]|nr:type III-B CRISPR-associated protein Cas10/Cmr2 [Spirochaetota bacterium]
MGLRNDYWQHKVSMFLHDPVDKAFSIPGHEERAAAIARLLKQSVADKEQYQAADRIASGLTRAAVPGYSTDGNENGAVDFIKQPALTHPIAAAVLAIDGIAGVSVSKLHEDILALLCQDLGVDKDVAQLNALPEGERPLNAFYNHVQDHEAWSKALYHYLFFALRKRLRNAKTGGLCGVWDHLPADTRLPDHSIWQHCALTSAIGSCLADSQKHAVSLVVFSITPVQQFIAKARKLRDSWTGSILLSYLAFIGLRTVMDRLGPDHVVYPSLHDQSLVEAWVGREYHLEQFLYESDDTLNKHVKDGSIIASFPNKFVFLCAGEMVQEMVKTIEASVQAEWLRLASLVTDYISNDASVKKMFADQVDDYWQYSWSATHLVGLDASEVLSKVLAVKKRETEQATVTEFAKAYPGGHAIARLYGATHSLVNGLLASAKLVPIKIRKSQAGEKCPLCGEHEVLHDFTMAGKTPAREYSAAVRRFWDVLRKRMNPQGSTTQVGENERLCAICTIKRFLPQLMKKANLAGELLHGVFKDSEKFPSTTEIAATRYLKKLGAALGTDRMSAIKNDLIGALHQAELADEETDIGRCVKQIVQDGEAKDVRFANRDKYYAVLLMDGDRMGDLINGETIGARWQDVMHPELKKRYENKGFARSSVFRNDINIAGASRPLITSTRTINPAIHAAISDSLNSFARFAVAPVIKKYRGRLIYAGGDDVCAVLPLDSVLDAAQEISRACTMAFVGYGKDGAEPVDKIGVESGKIGVHLGKTDGISISGGIVIAHHKTPLREVMRDAHAVLDGIAKKKAGRNALAIRLKKRSGGDRDVFFKWNKENPFMTGETLLDSFRMVMAHIADEAASSRLMYRLASLEEVVRPLVPDAARLAENRERIVSLFVYEVGHSGSMPANLTKDQKKDFSLEMARRLAGLCVQASADNHDWFNPEGPVIGQFFSGEGA